MAEQNPNPTFQWRSQADKPALPTDYTPSALAATWGFHHDTIAKYITMHPIFDPFYQWMRYANKEVVGSSPYKHRGIPAELEPFFHAYLDFLFPANEASKVNNKTSINEQARLFSLNLYQKAVAAEKAYEKDHIGSGEAQPTNSNEDDAVHSGLYWYRRLYENPHFQNAVLGDYWRKEYAWRCQLIEELSLQLPQVQQIHELKTMISYMDIRIAYLLCCVERSTESNEIETQSITLDKSGFEFEDSFLSTFPPQLIHSMRNTNRKVDPRLLYTKRTEYIIPNIPIHVDNPKIKDMKDAFNLISKPKTDSAIRRDIQSEYLNLVCDIPAKSDFQKASEDLQNYLNLYSTTDHDLETYNRFIVNCCFRTYRNIMWYSIPMIDDVMGQPINDAALQQFVETSVSNFYSLFYYPIAHIVSFTQSAFRFDIADYCERHRKAIE